MNFCEKICIQPQTATSSSSNQALFVFVFRPAICQKLFPYHSKKFLIIIYSQKQLNAMHPYYFMPGFTYYPPSFPSYPQGFPQNVPMTMFNSQQPLPLQVQAPPQIEEQPQVKQYIRTPVATAKKPEHRHRKYVKRESRRKERAGQNIQLENRNILPNMNNVLLSYTRRVSRSGPVVQKIMRKLLNGRQQNIEALMKKFYAYQNYLKNNVNDFIIREAIRAVMNHSSPTSPSFSLEDQHFFNTVFRMAIKHYLDEDYLTSSLSSPMDRVKRKDHLKVRRYLLNMVKG